MEKPKIEKIMELDIIPDPRTAQYITQNLILISNHSTCKIVDTNQRIMMDARLDKGSLFAGIHTKSNRMAFYSQNTITQQTSYWSQKIKQNNIKIYDINSNKLLQTITRKNKPQRFIFSSLDNIVVLGYTKSCNIIIYDYIKQSIIEKQFADLASFACHPTKQQICVACNFKKPVIYSMDNFNVIKTMPLSDFMAVDMGYTFCAYSSGGSFIATGSNPFIYIWDLGADKAHLLPVEEDEKITKITFHPNDIVLALLSKTLFRPTEHQKLLRKLPEQEFFHIVRYWNVRKRKPVEEMRIKNITEDNVHDLSFSRDGKTIVVTFDNKCVVYSVPPEVTNPEEVS